MGQEAQKEFTEMQKGDVERTWANIDRARKELGYSPRVSLPEGIDHFCRWFRNEWNKD